MLVGKKTEGKCFAKQLLVASMQLMYVHPVAMGLEASSGGTATARVESQATGFLPGFASLT